MSSDVDFIEIEHLRPAPPPPAPNGHDALDPCAYEWGAEPLLHPDDCPDSLEGADVPSFRGNVEPFPPKPAPDEPFFRDTREDEQRPVARVTDAGTFLRAYKPISYTIEGALPSGYLYGLTGRQGAGKTSWMIAAALAIVSGDERIIGFKVTQGRVAYVAMENPDDFRMKLAVNAYLHGIVLAPDDHQMVVIDCRTTPEAMFEALKLDAEEHGPFQAVLYDTFQAGFSAAGGAEFNDNADVLKVIIKLRIFTGLPGRPSVLVAFHPIKNATADDLVPYGGGAIMNEIDGNLTVWAEAPRQIKFSWNRVRGPEFGPRYFRIEKSCSPDIADIHGRQIEMPVLRPSSQQDVEERAAADRNTEVELLRAMLADPKASQRELAQAVGRSVSTVNKYIGRLEKAKLGELMLGRWVVSEKAKKLLNSST